MSNSLREDEPECLGNTEFSLARTTAAPKFDHHIRLLDLPQNILDRIFGLAYPHKEGLRLFTRNDWARRKEALPANAQGSEMDFPAEKVCDWLISKRFFVAAAKAWVGNQIFDDANFIQPARSCLEQGRDGGAIFSFAKNFHIAPKHLGLLRSLPSLEVLYIDTSDGDFNDAEKRRPWMELFDRDDFERSMLFCKIFCLDGPPKRVYLKEMPCPQSHCEELGSLIWEENVKEMQSIINDRFRENGIFLRRLKEQRLQAKHFVVVLDAPRDGRSPLYDGSKVYFAAARHDSVGAAGLP